MIPIKDDNPTRTVPFVTVFLIILNCIIYFYQMILPQELGQLLVLKYGVVPYEIIHLIDVRPEIPIPVFLTIITSQFLHGSIIHLGGNMLYLWIFGNNIEDIMGHFRFLLFYLICGALAATAHIITQPGSTVPTIGASGAISGVLGAYLLKFPRARVLVVFWFFFFIRLIKVPALIVLGFWIFVQIWSGVISMGSTGGGIAWFAHIGGFLAGLILVKLFERRKLRWKFR